MPCHASLQAIYPDVPLADLHIGLKLASVFLEVECLGGLTLEKVTLHDQNTIDCHGGLWVSLLKMRERRLQLLLNVVGDLVYLFKFMNGPVRQPLVFIETGIVFDEFVFTAS